MTKAILVANWKNYPGSIAEAKSLLNNLVRDYRTYKKLNLFIAPPAPYLELVSSKVKSLGSLASQDFPALEKKETRTGSITGDILKSFGIKLSIIGHSEIRAQGETSQEVSNKVKLALSAGITPLVCIGEKVHDNDGDYFEYLEEQIKSSLEGISRKDMKKVIVAYEPVWAIGKDATGVIEPKDLTQTIIFIRKILSDIFTGDIALSVPILYGGSVDVSNIEGLWNETGVSGFLVGRASLDAKVFKKLTEILITK